MPPDNDLDPNQLDMLTRTILGEAGNQSPVGQAAVAHVILNRVKDGGYGGDNPTSVVLAPSQFESWGTRTKELATIPRTSPEYQSALAIAKGVAAGDIPDPTSGATHYANVDTVKSRGNNKAMGWINGMQNVTKIGDHTFGNADAPQASAFNQEQPPQDFLGAFIKSKSSPNTSAPTPSKSDTPDYLSDFVKAKTSEPSSLPPEGYYGGRQHVNIGPAVPFSAQDSSGNTIHIQPDDPRYPVANPNPQQHFLPQIAQDYGNRVNEIAGQNADLVGKGMSDIAQGNVASGTAKAGLGALGYFFSPGTGLDKPIENTTGNKNFGELASMLIPGTPLGKVANAARPAVGALTDIVKDVGVENIPSIISRLESNPKLTLMDVAPTVRGNAAGLATDPRNVPAMNQLNQFQKERMADRSADTVNIFEDALGKTPNMAATVKELKSSAQETGKNLIEPSIKSAGPVDVTSIVNNIDKQLPTAMTNQLKETGKFDGPMTETEKNLWSLRQRIRGKWNDRDEMFLDPDKAHEIQKELRLGSQDPLTGYHGRQVRRELIDALDKATEKGGNPGTYKPALKQYADDKAVEEAFHKGLNVYSNPTGAEGTIANHPDAWNEWMKDASDAEKRAVAKGILFASNNKAANARTGAVSIPEDSFVHQRIASVVGKKNADEIVRRLGDWRDIAETDNLLTKNSATAVRQAGQEARSVRDNKSGKEILQNLVPAAVIGGAAHIASGGSSIMSMLAGGGAIAAGKLHNIAGKAHDIASNKAYAQWASATGQKKQDLIEALRTMANKQNPGNRLSSSSILQSLPR